ncbi:hypothetical protein BGX21_005182 [Mortierella sp. AD011]|nr:hypothetical protein BGX20_005353 [Mortierella sp. AD010]KAF9371327.1 hypothetical protein BGX21_005182 [Mortierella sp. AD011]
MRGIPVAFMLTNDQSVRPLELWLSEMNKLAGPLKYVTIGDSRVEFRTIQDAFEGSVKIHLCPWHVARAWSQKICYIVRVADKEETMKYRNKHMRQTSLLIVEFRQEWSIRLPEFATFIEDNYIGPEEHRKKWMKTYRTDTFYAAADTNNFVESWHSILKNTLLGKQYKLCPNRVVYLLNQVVIGYFEKEELQAQFQVSRLTRDQVAGILRQCEVRSMDD